MSLLAKLSLTKDEKLQLLLLNDFNWRRVKSSAKIWLTSSATLNLIPQGDLAFLRDMPADSWFRQAKMLDLLRAEHKDALAKKRKELAVARTKARRNKYMREYMKRRRVSKAAERVEDNSRSPEEDLAATRALIQEGAQA